MPSGHRLRQNRIKARRGKCRRHIHIRRHRRNANPRETGIRTNVPRQGLTRHIGHPKIRQNGRERLAFKRGDRFPALPTATKGMCARDSMTLITLRFNATSSTTSTLPFTSADETDIASAWRADSSSAGR